MTTTATATTADLCVGTPTVQVVDNRGLAVRALQVNRSAPGDAADEQITRQRYSPIGHLLSSLDPRLFETQQLDPAVTPNFRYRHSLSGQVLRQQGVDAGQHVQLSDIAGGLLWQQGARGQFKRCSYDALHRLSTLHEQDSPSAPERISERYRYAEPQAPAAANARGQLVDQYDTAGLNQVPRYTVAGQPLLSVRQLLSDAQALSDWQGDEAAWQAQLAPERYTSQVQYNALSVVVRSVDAKGNQHHQRLNLAGQLASSGLTLAGHTTERAILTAIRYSAAGQVQDEEAGNGVVSEYHYQPQTQRLRRLLTTRPAHNGRPTRLQDLSYAYDPVGNILQIADAAQPVRYHHNQRVVPANDYQYDALYQLTCATGRENAGAAAQGPGLPVPQVPLSVDPNAFSTYTRRYSYDRGANLLRIRHQGAQDYTLDMLVAPTSNRAVQQTGHLTPGDVDGHFDAAGNLLQLAPGQALRWDGRNQLQRVAQVLRHNALDDAETYQYDGAGQRLRKTTLSHTRGTVRSAQVLYLPGLELRVTQREQGGTSRTVEELHVISAGGAGRQQVRVLHWEAGQPADIPNDQLRGSLDNQIGSSLLELDQQAEILTLEEYFPFGGTAVWSGKTVSETKYKFVRYSGQERDASGLYYYGFRYYAPWLGRWLNPDPAGTVDGLNLFAMVKNNPINNRDSKGLNSIPKIAHYAWEGDELSRVFLFNILNFKRLNPEYEVTLWTSRPMTFFKPLEQALSGDIPYYRYLAFKHGRKIKIKDPRKLYKDQNSTLYSLYERERSGVYQNLAAASDITRIAVINALGGLYMDVDVSVSRKIKNIDGGRDEFFMHYDPQNEVYGNGIIASAPRTPATLRMEETIINSYQDINMWMSKRSHEETRFEATVVATGPDMIMDSADDDLRALSDCAFGQRNDLSRSRCWTGNWIKKIGESIPKISFDKVQLLNLGHIQRLNDENNWSAINPKRRSSVS
jgi:insecticidal toxin complex protein TccC